MGNFFTSSQIFNGEGLDKQQFIDKFCKAMADSGYVVCDSDEGEKSYILRFDADSKWVAIASEEYAQNSNAAKIDAGRIAKMLGTYCMNTEVIDSDCAAMSLYGKDGKSADMLLMGRYDDYFGDDNPEPNEKIWSQFLSGGSTWEQFKEILGGEYVFVEDGLSQLAPVIGMDRGNLLFSAEDDTDDEMAVLLDFKKAGAKKKKKLTLKSAFIKVFGEALEPLGYKKVKGANAEYVRVVNDEIIHIISLEQTKCSVPGEKSFDIQGTVSSIYNDYLDLSVKPEDRDRLISNFKIYSYQEHNMEYDSNFQQKLYEFRCKDDNISIMNEMENALTISKKWLIPFIHAINNVDDLFKYLLMYNPSFLDSKNELLYLKVNNYSDAIIEIRRIQNDNYKKCVDLKRNGYTLEKYKKRIDKADILNQQQIAEILEVQENSKLYAEYKLKEEYAKEKNLNMLKKYMII
ncbi:MAG TPA: hypothetical protein PLH98_05305 [Ruminococcus flavefaciens]|nr:hypothetical protein [Ruminococcus flavefaciens]